MTPGVVEHQVALAGFETGELRIGRDAHADVEKGGRNAVAAQDPQRRRAVVAGAVVEGQADPLTTLVVVLPVRRTRTCGPRHGGHSQW
jgi:hypothetical protein